MNFSLLDVEEETVLCSDGADGCRAPGIVDKQQRGAGGAARRKSAAGDKRRWVLVATAVSVSQHRARAAGRVTVSWAAPGGTWPAG